MTGEARQDSGVAGSRPEPAGARAANSARTIFLGSGAFAVPIVAALADDPGLELIAVVTAPPRPAGRGSRLRPSPVGAWAAGRGIAALTPLRLRDPATVAELAALAPDLLVLADYGRLVPPQILALPPHGALNVHPSLLPRHRGATPVPGAILAGDAQSGVTLMRMDEGLDTGPILAQRRAAVGPEETAPELEERLAAMGADILIETLPGWLRGEVRARPQPHGGATLTRPLRKEDGALDPSRGAIELEHQVRAYQPWPGSHLKARDDRIVVWRARAWTAGTDDRSAGSSARGSEEVPGSGAGGSGSQPPPDVGRLIGLDGGLGLLTSDGVLELLEVQPAGGRRMTAAELVRGRPGLAGARIQTIGTRGGSPGAPDPAHAPSTQPDDAAG